MICEFCERNDCLGDCRIVVENVKRRTAEDFREEGRQQVREVLWYFVHKLVDKHPLPWRIELDWTVELYDANNQCIDKYMQVAHAEQVIKLAEKIHEDDKKATEWLKEQGIFLDP